MFIAGGSNNYFSVYYILNKLKKYYLMNQV